jgi:hypothetical protein
VAYRHLSADCDQFAYALRFVTGWPLVGSAAHRLSQGSRGLIDASGWTTPNKLMRRYRDMGDELRPTPDLGDDWGLCEAVSAIRQFPRAPFNTAAFGKMS